MIQLKKPWNIPTYVLINLFALQHARFSGENKTWKSTTERTSELAI